MPPVPGNQPSGQVPDPSLGRLRRAEDRLYSPAAAGGEIRRRRTLRPTKENTLPGWPSTESSLSSDAYIDSIRGKPRSPFAKILIVAALFFLAALVYGGWKLYGGGALAVSEGSEDVRITVAGPNEAPGGDALFFDVVVQNAGPVPLLLPDLIVNFPDGTKDPETKSQPLQETRVPLGDVAPGATVRKTVGATLFGETGEVETIQVRVQYRSPGSDAIFEKRRSYDVAIAEAAVRVTVEALERVTSGQAMPLQIRISSEAPVPVTGLGLSVSLPYGYTATGYSTPPASGSFWNLGTLAPGEERTIRIDGTLEGSDGDRRTFKFQVGQAASGTDAVAVPYSGRQITVAIEKPFLGISLSLNGEASPAVARQAGKTIDGLLTITNNTDATIHDIAVAARFTGAALDGSSVLVPYGSYLSSENIVRWDKSDGAGGLASIAPGKSEILALSFESKPLVVAGRATFQNPELVIDLEAVGRRVSEEGDSEEIRSEAARRIRFISDVAATAARSHVSGPRPPAVDQLPVYSLVWTVKNSASELADVTLRATLPPQVSWVELDSGGLPGLSFDAPSRTLTWSIGTVPAGAGYGQPAAIVSFNLALRPSVSQVGYYPTLLGVSTLSGRDTFAGVRISEAGEAVGTERPKSTESDPGKVVQ